MAFPHAAPAGNLNVNGDLNFSKIGSRIRVAFASGGRAEQRTIFTTVPGQTAVFGTMPGLGGATSVMQVYDRNLDAKDRRGFCYGDFRTGTGLGQVRITSASLGPDSTGTGAPAAYPICLFVNGHSHLFNTDGSLSFSDATWTVDASGNISTPANVDAATATIGVGGMSCLGAISYGSATGGHILSTQVTVDAGGALILKDASDAHYFSMIHTDLTPSGGRIEWSYDGAGANTVLQDDGTFLTVGPIATSGLLTASSAQIGGTTIAGSGNNAVMQRIGQVICAGSQSTVVFSSIPAGFTNLVVVFQARDTTAGTATSILRLKMNADATSGNYSSTQNITGSATTASASVTAASAAGGSIGFTPNNGSTSGVASAGEVLIPRYSDTTFFKEAIAKTYGRNGTSTVTTITHNAFTWASTAAIATLTFGAGTAFVDGSCFTLYGEP